MQYLYGKPILYNGKFPKIYNRVDMKSSCLTSRASSHWTKGKQKTANVIKTVLDSGFHTVESRLFLSVELGSRTMVEL